MSDQAKVCWNSQRNEWGVRLWWQGKRLYFSRYMGQLKCGKDPDVRCRVAEKIASDINSEIDKGIFNPDRHKQEKPLHLKQYYEKWIQNIRVGKATAKDYQNSFQNHIIPAIGDKYIIDINYDVLQELQNEIAREPKGKKNVMGALRKMFSDALKSNHIQTMPVFPSFTGVDSIEQKVPEWIDRETQDRIIAEIAPAEQHIFRFMFATGCRPSEARAFRWQDIKQGYIIFRVTFGYDETLKEIKNKKERRFPVTNELALIIGSIPKNLKHFVFINPRTKKPYSKNINRDIWNPACQKAIGYVFPLNNAGRHSYANQLLELPKPGNCLSQSSFLRSCSLPELSMKRSQIRLDRTTRKGQT